MTRMTIGDPVGFHLENLGLTLNAQPVLREISLRLAPGRVCGVIGRNGSGKSSLLRVLARLSPADAGTCRLDGKPLDAWKSRDFARRVALMPQSAPATGVMVLQDLVALGRYPWHGAFGRAGPKDQRAIAEAIALCGLEGLATRPLDSLSGGEAQRARLAMMLAQGADWLLLDEPSASLDLAWSFDLLSALRGLAREAGRGVVIALHDMNLAARFCDDLVALKGGRVTGAGAVADVFRAPILSETFGLAVTTGSVAGLPVAIPSP